MRKVSDPAGRQPISAKRLHLETPRRRPSAPMRRDVLRTITSAAALGALATGIPVQVLLSPRAARAQAFTRPSTLLMFTSQNGDPLNANVPGTYGAGLEDIVHPPDPAMAATPLTLSGRPYVAAKPWADLPQATLDRTVFFHHATYTPLHQDHPRVMRILGQSQDDEMFVSILADDMATQLGSLQSTPISVGATNPTELLSAGGRTLANVSPSSLRGVLGGPDGPLATLADLRDREVDKMYELFKRHGSTRELTLLDGWARARSDALNISDSLIAQLDEISGNEPDDQVVAAAVLAAMNVAPAITLHGSFGGDNHQDPGLTIEVAEQVSGIGRIQNLVGRLDAMQASGALPNEFLVAVWNVFGRTLTTGLNGRDHNRNHNVAVLIGNTLHGSVIGGVERGAADYVAASIDTSTGEPGGTIFFDATLGAFAKTLGLAVGVNNEKLDQFVLRGVPLFFAFRGEN